MPEGPTKIGDRAPPTWQELEAAIAELGELLTLWERAIAIQLPSKTDKREFLAVMANFYERTERLQSQYYQLVDAVNYQLALIKSHPAAYKLEAEFAETVNAMKSLKDVRRKWYRHKK